MRTLKRSARNVLLHPRYFRLPLRPEGLCGNDAQSVMLSLLVQMHRQTASWDALTLGAIGEHIAQVRGQSVRSPFRSLPDRVMFKGLDGLRDNGLLVEIKADTHFATQYLPTGAFFEVIRPFHVAHPQRWVRRVGRST